MSHRQITIAIDAMGGEGSPLKCLKGAEIFSNNHQGVMLQFLGDQDLIKQTILDAQKNITIKVEEEPKTEQIKKENSNNEKKLKSKANDKKKKPITEIKGSPTKSKVKKTSLLSKIKSLTSTKKK